MAQTACLKPKRSSNLQTQFRRRTNTDPQLAAADWRNCREAHQHSRNCSGDHGRSACFRAAGLSPGPYWRYRARSEEEVAEGPDSNNSRLSLAGTTSFCQIARATLNKKRRSRSSKRRSCSLGCWRRTRFDQTLDLTYISEKEFITIKAMITGVSLRKIS